MSHPQFAAIVAFARRTTEMTAAEMDYSLACDGGAGKAGRALNEASWAIANEGRPEAEYWGDAARERAHALWAEVRPDFDAMVTAARAKKYLGWSDAARARGQRIRYATN